MFNTGGLPAPLGPIRPVTPASSVIVMSLTATTLPYHFDTPCRSTELLIEPPSDSAPTVGVPTPRRDPARRGHRPGRTDQACSWPRTTIGQPRRPESSGSPVRPAATSWPRLR